MPRRGAQLRLEVVDPFARLPDMRFDCARPLPGGPDHGATPVRTARTRPERRGDPDQSGTST
jgi:hypothetical protein